MKRKQIIKAGYQNTASNSDSPRALSINVSGFIMTARGHITERDANKKWL